MLGNTSSGASRSVFVPRELTFARDPAEPPRVDSIPLTTDDKVERYPHDIPTETKSPLPAGMQKKGGDCYLHLN